MREVDGKSDTCIFEWLLCLDLKGYFPRRLLDAVRIEDDQNIFVSLITYCRFFPDIHDIHARLHGVSKEILCGN